MFKVYYKGELASEQEFATKSEAKKSIVAVLAGQEGKTVSEIMPEIEYRGYYTTQRDVVERKCVICGKTFTVPSERSKKITCSDACAKEHLKNYNSLYHKRRYQDNDEYRERVRKHNLHSTHRGHAKNRWQRRVEFANDIYALAQHENAIDLIATYIDKSVITRGRRGKGNSSQFRTDAEVAAEKLYLQVAPQLLTSAKVNDKI